MKFYIKDIPSSMTVTDYIKTNSDYLELARTVKPKNVPRGTKSLIFDAPEIDYASIYASILEACSIYGEYGWQTKLTESKIYTGFSLMHNPNHLDVENKHRSTLGTKTMLDFTKYKDNINKKNSYADTLSFRLRTDASKHGKLGEFLDTIGLSLTRGRLSTVNADKFINDAQLNAYGWHYDESIFENLRLNIPVHTDEIFLFQIEGEEPVHLNTGRAYTWDTAIPHRIFATEIANKKRTHLVIGMSPWFRYIPEEDAWETNEYYGVKHPFDIMIEGGVLPHLKLVDYK